MKMGQAGTLESNDIIITVSEAEKGSGIQVELTSIVLPQFGQMIRHTLERVCQHEGVTDVLITASDKGALDYTIEARLKTALQRAGMI